MDLKCDWCGKKSTAFEAAEGRLIFCDARCHKEHTDHLKRHPVLAHYVSLTPPERDALLDAGMFRNFYARAPPPGACCARK